MRRSDFIHLVIGSATVIPCFLGILLYAPTVDAPPKTTPDVPPPAAKTEPIITQLVEDADEEIETTETTVETTAVPFYIAYSLEEMEQLKAGEDLYRELPDAIIDDCFTVSPITDEVYSRMNGISYVANENVLISDLSYIRILHYTPDGQRRIGELIVNKLIADDVKEIMHELYNVQYPIERMVLVDEYGGDDNLAMADNNSYAFNYRGSANSETVTAQGQGLSININPVYNPYVSDGGTTIRPKKGLAYANRDESGPMMIDVTDFCYQIFTAHGFSWGGSWGSTKNYMYFEKKPTNAT
ncbi:MAG: M15 family metallopeptidase [Oscillospiraceae bacterium]|nr:M15 family metallopeptidase [Oscillospiraceae bacterium]